MSEDYLGNDIADPYQPDADGMVTVWEIGVNDGDFTLVRGWTDAQEKVMDVSYDADLTIDDATNQSETLTITLQLVRFAAARWKTFAESWADGRGEGLNIYDIDDEGNAG